MHFDLKPISEDSIPEALAKVEPSSRRFGYVTPFSWRNRCAAPWSFGQFPPTYSIPITVTPRDPSEENTDSRTGCSSRHGGQSWFQKFTTTTFP